MDKTIILSAFLSAMALQGQAMEKEYALWYTAPACNRGGDFTNVVSRGFPFDTDWETWSLPIGNGAMGACIFGRTDTERIQISEKTLGYKGPYGDGDKGTFTNFVEVYIDFNHRYYKNYKRSLSLDNAVSTVTYEYDGVKYTREYFANYPSQIIAVKVKADAAGKVSFKLHPELPYLRPYDAEDNGRSGKVTASGNLITMRGEMQIHKQSYEGQIKVVNYGGTMSAAGDAIDVNRADSAVLYIATGTNYQLNENVFLLAKEQKLQGNPDPHGVVSQRIEQATHKGYEQLREEHIADYRKYFGRVSLSLTDKTPTIPTDKLLAAYKVGKTNPYLEELFFQYGRYLLIASSRAGSLPANLQGAWSQYEVSPWSGGYWHNINVQMNYWPVFNTNLSDMFDSYMDYNEAFRKAAMQKATEYITENNPSALDAKGGDNGWTIGTGATAFGIEAPGKHSGPGTGGFTTKLFWDYYDFTRDKQLLKEHVYPALYGMAKFLHKTLKEQPDGTLLADPSFSPEQRHKGEHYQCKGCTFDQCMILENYRDLLRAASILKIKDPFLKTIEKEIPRLDPIEIGESGQIKEFREEKKYGDIGETHHRHISHLCALYPGTMITSATPEWMKAATVSLTMRGDRSTGWAMAHRQVSWARLKNGDRAYQLYKGILSERVMQNLWAFHPPFQIDANLGATAGVAEMLLQSHEGYVEPLPALPAAWKTGSYDGLMARGNFQVSAEWKDGKAVTFCIVSKKGELCRLKYAGIENASITDNRGKAVKVNKVGENLVEFKTVQGAEYTVTF